MNLSNLAPPTLCLQFQKKTSRQTMIETMYNDQIRVA